MSATTEGVIPNGITLALAQWAIKEAVDRLEEPPPILQPYVVGANRIEISGAYRWKVVLREALMKAVVNG